eukprot:gene18557-biopygen2432
MVVTTKIMGDSWDYSIGTGGDDRGDNGGDDEPNPQGGATWAQNTVQRMRPSCRPACSVILSKWQPPEPDSSPRDQHPPSLQRPAPWPALHAPSDTAPSWQPRSGIINISGDGRGGVVAGVPSG